MKLTTEFTKAATNYCDLHKHAAAQDALVRHEAIALRLTAAYMIGQSHLWTIRTEKGRADNPETKASVDASASRASFESSKGEAFDLLGVDEEDRPECLSDSSWQGAPVAEVFAKLCAMKDSEVLTLMAIAMAETLEAKTALVDTLGTMMKIDMAQVWSADDAFLDLVTSKATLLSMLEGIGGPDAASAHKDSTGKVIRSVIRQFALGEGREKAQGWLPKAMRFDTVIAEDADDEALAA